MEFLAGFVLIIVTLGVFFAMFNKKPHVNRNAWGNKIPLNRRNKNIY